ncbi:hypothetical protein K0M31_018051 [Melipona bicolor]|uniref:Uncharacterized protein n=1 Tax=Melipona bicolor TaxID=60889 RepID=A0AA40KDX2_9HYME|nr:hypothetical protein K0M31_018051 [Melipona bicolor]
MRNIIQDRGRWRRDGGRNWLGDGEKAPGDDEPEKAREWDECQNVASPDERE